MNKRLARKGSLSAADDTERAVLFLCGWLAACLFPAAHSLIENAAGAVGGVLGIFASASLMRAIVGGRRRG